MRKSIGIFLLLAATALAQNTGGNFRGAIRGKLFRDLSTDPRGLFHGRTDMAPRVLLAPNDVHIPGTSANCVVGLVEVPMAKVDDRMIVGPPNGNFGPSSNSSFDRGIVIAPTLPTCPPRR